MSSLLKLYFTNWEIKPHSQSWLAVTWDNTLLEPHHTPHSLISDPDHVCVATCTPHVPALLSSVFLHIRVLLSGMHFRPLGHFFVLHCHPSVSLALEFSSLGQALFCSTHTALLHYLCLWHLVRGTASSLRTAFCSPLHSRALGRTWHAGGTRCLFAEINSPKSQHRRTYEASGTVFMY